MNIRQLSLGTTRRLTAWADIYEQPRFMENDPSGFMHRVKGAANAEVTAFVASCLSYGSRSQFLPKMERLLALSGGDMYHWVSEGQFYTDLPDDDSCFYRLYSHRMMRRFLGALQDILKDNGSLGQFVHRHVTTSPYTLGDSVAALKLLGDYFREHDVKAIVPRPITSACKRPCMFMRWMVRDGSPIDLGLWTTFIDKRTLIIPLDTHVLRVARSLGIVSTKSAGWSAAVTITQAMLQVFPDDPCKADFALFGYGIHHVDKTQ